MCRTTRRRTSVRERVEKTELVLASRCQPGGQAVSGGTMRPHKNFATRVAIAVVISSLIAAACGDDKSDDANTGNGTSVSSTTGVTTTKAPQSGGILSFAEFSEPISLDPIVAAGNGSSGAIEMAAVYDTLLRYDPQSGKYEPRTAES